jgi:hypothetical protein
MPYRVVKPGSAPVSEFDDRTGCRRVQSLVDLSGHDGSSVATLLFVSLPALWWRRRRSNISHNQGYNQYASTQADDSTLRAVRAPR